MKTLDYKGTGVKIRDVCKEQNLSADHVAEMLNVSKQTVYSWWSSKKCPSVDHLVELSSIIDIPVDELIVKRTFEP